MPPRIAPARLRAEDMIVVPRRVALAMAPELERQAIPARVTLSTDAPPYAGETREAQWHDLRGVLPVGEQATLATLRRAWELVGFMVDPGNAGAPGLTCRLQILGSSLNGRAAAVVAVNALGVQAFGGFLLGARCELVVTNTTGSPIRGIRGEIWGMAQR